MKLCEPRQGTRVDAGTCLIRRQIPHPDMGQGEMCGQQPGEGEGVAGRLCRLKGWEPGLVWFGLETSACWSVRAELVEE